MTKIGRINGVLRKDESYNKKFEEEDDVELIY